MKLYEVKQKPLAGQWPGKMPAALVSNLMTGAKTAYFETWYFTSHQVAKGHFVKTKAALKKANLSSSLELNQLEVKTTLKAAEWIQLLESDAPGMKMTLTPQDLIISSHTSQNWDWGRK